MPVWTSASPSRLVWRNWLHTSARPCAADVWRRGGTPYLNLPSLQIDLVFRRIYCGGCSHLLSGRQFQLLKLLLDADGRVLTHRDLVHAIWGHDGGGSVALLRKVVRDLRRKIEPNPKQPLHILSHSRVGYRFARSPL